MRAGRKTSALWLVAGILVAFLLCVPAARAQPRDLEAAVKATYLTRFAAFAAWPPSSFTDASAPIVICVAGNASLADLVERAAAGAHVGTRSLTVRRLADVPSGAGCHILYAGGASAQSVAQMLEAVRGRAVLTVTDERRGRARGMIHFTLEDGRVRFHVDRDAADAAGLNLNARLLSVALSVRSRRGP